MGAERALGSFDPGVAGAPETGKSSPTTNSDQEAIPLKVWKLSLPRDDKGQKIAYNIDGPSNGEILQTCADRRVRVARDQFDSINGALRFVCKLFCKYERGDGELVGSGFLIANDMIITAGHVGYDWGTCERGNYGALISVKVYIGYDGQHSLQNSSCVRRHGRSIAVPTDWVKQFYGSKDFGIILLDKPYEDVRPVEFMDMPPYGDETLYVIGYLNEHMLLHSLATQWTSPTSELGMFLHKLDTTPGQSGAPLACFRDDKYVALGLHVHGGEHPGTPNKAVVFGSAGIPVKEIVTAVREFDVAEGGGATFRTQWADGAVEIIVTRSTNEKLSTGLGLNMLLNSEDENDSPLVMGDNAITTLSPKEEPTTPPIMYTPSASEEAKHYVPSTVSIYDDGSIVTAMEFLEKRLEVVRISVAGMEVA